MAAKQQGTQGKYNEKKTAIGNIGLAWDSGANH
jgi:hypothetical protein